LDIQGEPWISRENLGYPGRTLDIQGEPLTLKLIVIIIAGQLNLQATTAK
jgi:hypothetical protein